VRRATKNKQSARRFSEAGKRPAERKLFGKHIVADPTICHGQLTFVGTRIFVHDVLELVAVGLPWKRIIEACHGCIPEEAIAEAVRLAGTVYGTPDPVAGNGGQFTQ
jgi:uncharacterized protein (DUF433 family)